MTENKSVKTIKIKIIKQCDIKKCNICKRNKSSKYFNTDENECNGCINTSEECKGCKKERLYKYFIDEHGNEMDVCIPCNMKKNNKNKKSTDIFKIGEKEHRSCSKCPFVGNVDNFVGSKGKVIKKCHNCSNNKKGYDKKSKDAKKEIIIEMYVKKNGIDMKYCTRNGGHYSSVKNFSKKKNGRIKKGCKTCLSNEIGYGNQSIHKNKKCPCGIRQTYCAKHGGGGLCICKERRDRCKKCIGPKFGGSLCETHKSIIYSCVRCGGGCPHGVSCSSRCRDCGGSGFCSEHPTTRKEECVECGGASVCDHKKLRKNCDDCNGSSRCEHKRCKYTCTKCENSSGVCNHNGKNYVRRRCKICSPNGYLCEIVGKRVRNALKTKKSKKSIEYLGCGIIFYKKFIEDQFEEGMSWDNFNDIEIDHITPLSYPVDEYDEQGNVINRRDPTLAEIGERLHYTNTQPMWADQNRKKGNRYTGKYQSKKKD